jgi:hypothetical protein
MGRKILFISSIVLALFFLGLSIIEFATILSQRSILNYEVQHREDFFVEYGDLQRRERKLYVENARLEGMITNACNTLARTSWDVDKLVHQLNCEGITHNDPNVTGFLYSNQY